MVPPAPPQQHAAAEIPADGELSEASFGPDTLVTSSASHKNSVNKALSMLGLVPVPESRESVEAKKASSARHKQALTRAFDVLGINNKTAAPAPATEPVAPVEAPAATPAPETAAPRPAAPPTEKRVGGAALQRALAAKARMGGAAPAEVEEPAAAASTATATATEEIIPLPELLESPHADSSPAPAESAPVDLEAAVAVDLERARRGARDFATALLNGTVLVGAAGGALYAADVIGPHGVRADAWRELVAGGGAVACGTVAVLGTRLAQHWRALLAGTAGLLLHALVLLVLPALAQTTPLVALAATAVASLLSAGVIVQTRHPMAVFLGFVAALALPPWFAPDPVIIMPYAAVVNIAIAFCALRMRRLQPSVLGAAITGALLTFGGGWLAAACAACCTLAYFAQVALAPRLHRGPSHAAALLAAVAYVLFAATALVGLDGFIWVKGGALFAGAVLSALFAGALRRDEVLRGTLKAGAVLLLLAAVATGLGGNHLAPVALFTAMLFAIVAVTFHDAYLRAVGALMLVVAVGVLAKEGANAPLLSAAAVAASLLYAVRAKDHDAIPMRLLLLGIAHGALLAATGLVLAPITAAATWLCLALAYGLVGRRTGSIFWEIGAVATVGVAALWTIFVLAPDPVVLGACGAAILPHYWITRRTRGARTPELFVLLAGIVAAGAGAAALPGAVGWALTSVAMVAALATVFMLRRRPAPVMKVRIDLNPGAE